MNALLSTTTKTLYKHVLKPIFFLLDPEVAHNANVGAGKFFGDFWIIKTILNWTWAYHHPELTKVIDGIVFPNPVGLSAGFDYNGDLTGIIPAIGFGFHTIGTVTLEAYGGNPTPRLGRYPRSQALLVNKGLKTIGAFEIIKKLQKRDFSIPTGISIASTNRKFLSEAAQIKNITDCFKLFEKSGLKHAYYELNISCPNTFGGEPFTTPQRLGYLLQKMDVLKLSRPMYVKMPIDQSEEETVTLLKVLKKHRVNGVIIGNLTKDKSNPDVHPEDLKLWQTQRGNLSGKPTWRRSNTLIALTRRECGQDFTVIGTGGIFTGQDAETKMTLGADLVQLITGMIFEGPQVIGSINKHLKEHRI